MKYLSILIAGLLILSGCGPRESLELIDTKCHVNKDPDWSDFYSGLLKPFNEYTDEELLTMKDAYKEGDPMYWLSKNDPLYIDWNIPEKRGTNVDRSECQVSTIVIFDRFVGGFRYG